MTLPERARGAVERAVEYAALGVDAELWPLRARTGPGAFGGGDGERRE